MPKSKLKIDYSSRGRKKYDFSQPEPRTIKLSDYRQLVKLVAKYGLQSIQGALPAAAADKPLRGRPSRGRYPDYEKISDADWIDEQIETHRDAGHKAPIRQARIDYFHMENGFHLDPNDVQLATIKKKHLLGRKLRDAYYAGRK